ncbi:MAG: trigger factor [Faecalicoccus sp.]|nr:trigger factor [Faecalicoccus sp.]
METNWTLQEKSTGVLEVVVEGEDWKKAQKHAFNRLKRNVNIKGFRNGRVPDALVRKQIPQAAIYETAVDSIVNKVLADAVDELGLELVDRPTVDVKEVNDDKVTLVYNLTVSPEVTLGEYKGLDVKKADTEVTDEDVEEEVKRIQNRYADWVLREEDEAAQNGDQVVIDFVGFKDGVEFDGGSGEDYPLELGSNTFIPGFEEQLVGVKTGDVKDVEVTFPEDYAAADLAGQKAVFKVTVHDIKYKDLPEADDELVKKLNREGVETLEKFKEVTREELKESKERNAEQQFTNDLVEKARDNATVEIPDVMVNSQVDRQFQDFAQQMQSQGFSVTQYLEAVGQSAQQLRESMREDAANRVKASLVLEAIAKAEGLEVTAEDIDAEFKRMADLYQMEIDQIKKYIREDDIRYDLTQQKAIDLLKTTAQE